MDYEEFTGEVLQPPATNSNPNVPPVYIEAYELSKMATFSRIYPWDDGGGSQRPSSGIVYP